MRALSHLSRRYPTNKCFHGLLNDVLRDLSGNAWDNGPCGVWDQDLFCAWDRYSAVSSLALVRCSGLAPGAGRARCWLRDRGSWEVGVGREPPPIDCLPFFQGLYGVVWASTCICFLCSFPHFFSLAHPFTQLTKSVLSLASRSVTTVYFHFFLNLFIYWSTYLCKGVNGTRQMERPDADFIPKREESEPETSAQKRREIFLLRKFLLFILPICSYCSYVISI